MPKVGTSQEALYERAVFVYDGSLWRPLAANTSGQIVAALAAGSTIEVTQDQAAQLLATVNIAASQTIQVTQATPANLQAAVNLNADQNVQARAYGYISAAWQKQPLQFGYGDTVALVYENTALPAGATTYNFAAVPAGSVDVLTSIAMVYVGTVANVVLRAALVLDATAVYLYRVAPPVSGTYYDKQGTFVLGPGDNLQFVIAGATANDDAYMFAAGYRFAVNL